MNASNDWREVTLGEICSDISYGYTASARSNPIGPKFLRITDIVPNKIDWDKVPYCVINTPNYAKYSIKTGDIVIARTGATTGYNKVIKFSEAAVFASYLIRYRVDSYTVDPFYIGHLLQSSLWKNFVSSIIGGSAQPGANAKQFSTFEFLLPPLREQKAIAEILSSLDDKIDLLHRQNQTLAAVAQTLFRKWFIEDADASWEEVSLGDSTLAKIMPSSINRFEGEKIYLATADVKDEKIRSTNTKITYDKRPSRANMQPVKHSVWFAKKWGIRKVLMFDDFSEENQESMILSTGFSGLKTTAQSHYYVWCFILNQDFQNIKDGFVSGTVQPDINNDGIREINLPQPDGASLDNFNSQVTPIFAKIQANTKQINSLNTLRDILLPKLISGKIKIKPSEAP